jgi:NAD dependent epimerase/dehydratase
MKKILVTGAGGFIGSHLTEKLVQDGHTVKAFIHYNSQNFFGWLDKSKYNKHIEFVTGDIRDFDSVNSALKGCDTVFHLAALIGIPYSYVSPLAYIKTNIEGTYNIVQSARMLNMENVLITSTSETYGTAQFVPISEKHPLVGQSPYSASKISADQMALSFFKSFNTPIKIVRPFNTYGPRQSARAIIPTIISQLLSGETELRLGNLSPTRDLTFVKDTVKGYIEIANCKDAVGEFINIGMGEEISIENLVNLIIELSGKEAEIITDEKRIRPGKSEVERLLADNSKIKEKTNWLPDYNIRSGLTETIEWINANLNKYKPGIYNV